MALHCFGKRLRVDADAALSQGVLRQIKREAIGVVELESCFAVELVACFKRSRSLAEQKEAALQRSAEACLLQLQRLGDQRLGPHQFGKSKAHFMDQRRHQAEHQGITRAEQLQMPHGASHDAAQHIAAPLVRRQNAVGDQEAGRAQMVGNDAERGGAVLLRPAPERGGRRFNQAAEEIGFEDAFHALQHGRHALESHSRVDRRTRQRRPHAGRMLLELHEDQVPEFQETVAVLFRGAGRPALDMLAPVDEYFRARAAGAGVAHCPEIV